MNKCEGFAIIWKNIFCSAQKNKFIHDLCLYCVEPLWAQLANAAGNILRIERFFI